MKRAPNKVEGASRSPTPAAKRKPAGHATTTSDLRPRLQKYRLIEKGREQMRSEK